MMTSQQIIPLCTEVFAKSKGLEKPRIAENIKKRVLGIKKKSEADSKNKTNEAEEETS